LPQIIKAFANISPGKRNINQIVSRNQSRPHDCRNETIAIALSKDSYPWNGHLGRRKFLGQERR